MNDLPPQSQEWVREVDAKNASTRSAIERIRANTLMQRKATQANVNAAALQVPVVDSQASGTQVQTYQSVDLSSDGLSGTNGAYTTVATYTSKTPLGRNGSVEFFTTATVALSFTSAQSLPGFIRIGVNGTFSPAACFSTGSSGDTFGCTAYAGSVASTGGLTITVQVLLQNYAGVTGRTLVKSGLTGAWV